MSLYATFLPEPPLAESVCARARPPFTAAVCAGDGGRGAAPPAGIIRPVQRAYLASTRLLGAALLLVGVAMVASTIARGGGALAVGVLLGIMLAVVGAARLWLARGGAQ